MRVTAETITDEQIRQLWSLNPAGITGRTLFVAFGEPYPSGECPSLEEVSQARKVLADAWNSLHGGE